MNDRIAPLLALMITLGPYLLLGALLAFSEKIRQWREQWRRMHHDLWIEIEEPGDFWTLEGRSE